MFKRNKSYNEQASQARSETSFPSALPLRLLAGIMLIVLAIFLAYLPSINGEFVFDDDLMLTKNQLIKASDSLWKYWCTTEAKDYWPVTNTSLWIEWRLWGMNTTGYHVANLILHVIESLLIWLILRKLSVPGAFLAAMIFAVHPVNVESVAWISQQKNTLAMLFFLLSILWYLKLEIPSPLYIKDFYRKPSSLIPYPSSLLWYWLSLMTFVLAMLSKGSVAVLPVLLLGIVWWLRKSPSRSRWDLMRTAPFFVVAVLLTVVNIWFQTHGTKVVVRAAGFTERLLGGGGATWFYLYKALLPFDLAFVYPQWDIKTGNLLWWLPLLAALVVTAVLWWCRENWSRPLLFAWGFFCVALVPALGFTDVGFMQYSLVADHYQHIALIGVIALVAAGWDTWYKPLKGPVRWLASIVAIMAVGILVFLTWRQSAIYRDPVTLYQATLEKNPDCWMAHGNLGLEYAQTGRLQKAIEHYRQALRLNPDFPEAHNNLGNALMDTNRLQEAIEHCQQALRLEPNYPGAHYNLGNALIRAGRLEEAIQHYQQALRLNPYRPADVYNNLGIALAQIGQPREAIEQYEQALRLNPDLPDAHNNMATALLHTGRAEEAIKHCRLALRLKSDYPEAHNNLGIALAQTGRPEEAIEHFKQALQLRPDYINACKNLALAYASMSQSADAIATAQKAIELARSQMQMALAKQIEDWLISYRASLSVSPDTPPPAKSASPAP